MYVRCLNPYTIMLRDEKDKLIDAVFFEPGDIIKSNGLKEGGKIGLIITYNRQEVHTIVDEEYFEEITDDEWYELTGF